MRSWFLLFSLLLSLAFTQGACDQIPEEGTIVYDVDFPRADSDEAQGGSGGGGGSSNGSTPSGLSTSASVEVVTINEGATDTESFVLAGPPNGTVTITFSSGDTSEATLSPATMSFDNSTWNIPQTLTITAPEDYSVDGDQTTTISYTIASTDPTDTLHGAAGNFNVVTADSGATAVTVANNSPSLTEGTTDNNTTFQLSGPPNGTVTVTITSSDTGEATVSPTTLTFDNTTWNVPQTITLSGVEDYLIDGNQSSTISYTLSSTDTTEPFHNAFGSYTASIVDSGTRLFVVSDDSPTVNEGYSDNVTFALDSAPTGTVTVTLSSADDNETTVSPTTLTFNSGNYNVAQTITLYGTEDYIIDGDQQTVVTLALTSTNPADVVHNVSTSITVTTVDSGLGTAFSLSNSSPSTTEGTTDNSTTFVLLSPPKGTVTVTFSSADDNETVVSPSTLTFTPANWNVPQALPLVGVEDFVADGNQTTAMNVSFSSTDPTDGVHGESGSFNVITNDSGITGTFTLSPSTPSVGEGSSNNSSTFVLTSPPNGTVTVTLSSDNSSELGVSPTNLVFTPANWNVPQNFTVTGVEDFNVDGPQPTNISISYSSSDTTDGIHGQSSSFAVNVTDSGKGATTITSAVAGDQQVTLNWSGPAGMSSYTIYYTSDGSTPTTSSDNITITDGTATSYVASGLTGGLNYNFSIVANIGADSSNLVGPVAASPTSFTGCTTSGTLTDTDPDLLAHYAFENNLNDSAGSGTIGSPYNLTNTGGTIKYAQSCAYGQAAYFDSTTGYLQNSNFSRTNIPSLDSGNFTIALWVNRDADLPMPDFSSAISSKDISGNTGTWGDALQIDVGESGGNNYIRWNNAPPAGIGSQAMITDGTALSGWSYITAVHYDNDTAQLYRNGVLVGTHTTFPARWYKMKVGINRGGSEPWKGYIDEVKVYGRAFTGDNVTDACLLYEKCENLVAPNTPSGLAATDPNNGTSINLSWNSVTGADNYTVYWTSNPATPIDPSNPATYDNSTTVTGTSTTATGLTNGTSYDFTIIATNTAGNSSPATEVNATPTLVLPAAVDNATAYHGFYSAYGIESGTTYNFNPSYYITWNHHPDRASGDKYYIYISDNASVPIDPNDNTTYIATREKSYNSNNTQILTRPISIDPSNNDDFLVGIPPRFGVVFYDASKGVYSPISNQVTPPLASEALREIGDLRIQSGYFSAGDNSTLTSFTLGTDIKIVQKDPINVGERFIIDGAFLSSDVIPQVGGSSTYDYLRLTFFNPNLLTPYPNYGRVSDIGGYFNYTRAVPRLKTNIISSHSPGVCGTNNAADCDFGMEIQGEDSVGMIIHNGTLNGATDYAADGSSPPAYGSGEQQTSSVNVDNSSYAGMYVYTSTGTRVDINLTNADAAMSKVAIPFRSATNLTATPSGSNINLSWDNSTSFTNTYDIYRSTDNSTWSLVTSLNGYDNTTYTDASLADGTYYYKIGANGTYYSPDNSTVASGVISTGPTAIPDPTSLTAAGGEQQVKLTWTKVVGADYYRFHWKLDNVTTNLFINTASSSTYDGYFDVQGQNTTLYIHGGLAAGDYHYVMTAHTNAGYATAQFPDSSTAAKEGTATAFTTVTRVTDNDPNLRVYYDFDNSSGNALANKSTQPANPEAYDLSLAGNATIIFGGSHFNSDQAAYFDANGGYAHNDNFSDSNESLDNFTISMWVRPDEDMTTYASILATADSNGAGKFQISDNGSLGIVAMTDNKRQWLEAGTVPIDNWTHVVAVKNSSLVDNGTLTFYLNGLVGSNNMLYCPDNTKDTCADNNSLTDFDTAWDKIKLGINRQSQNAWKGYIDEVKVYNRSLSAQEVCNLYKNHGPLNTGATCP